MEWIHEALPEVPLIHELAHSLDFIRGTLDSRVWLEINGMYYAYCEIFACSIENKFRYEKGYPVRQFYSATIDSNNNIIPILKSMLPPFFRLL